MCTDTEGSFLCSCNTGYTGDGLDCRGQLLMLQLYLFTIISHSADINECGDDNSCGENAECVNSLGSYSCACLPGFTGDGMTCSSMF